MARKNARPQDPLVFQWLHESGFLDLQVQGMKKILQKLDIQTPGWAICRLADAAGSCLSLWSPIPPLIQLKMEHGPLNWLQDNQFADPILWIPCYMSGGILGVYPDDKHG